MYPLRFEPIFQRYVWGGRRLGEVFNKPIGEGAAAESWEVVDHGDAQSVVREGEFSGWTLSQLIAKFGNEVLGPELFASITSASLPDTLRARFPLLLKFLDANRNLSVQVHPDDQLGASLVPPDLGKTEAWYVMHAEPGAKIFAGLKAGVSENEFRLAIERGDVESTLHQFTPEKGDCVFIPAGTIHAIGAGLLIAEIQQASNTTFRVYDWGRVGNDGVPRPLHVESSIEATDFKLGPVAPQIPVPLGDTPWVRLVGCEKFEMSRAFMGEPFEMGGDGRCRILAVTQGSLRLSGDPCTEPLKLADTVLLPACLGVTSVEPGNDGVELLEITIPTNP